MSTSAPEQVTVEDIVETLEKIDGDLALDYLEGVLEVLKLTARSESLAANQSKTTRETATYAEIWIGNVLDRLTTIRSSREP